MTQLTISSLVAELTKMHAEHGDLPIVLIGVLSIIIYKLKAEHVQVNDVHYPRKVVTLKIKYLDEREKEMGDNLSYMPNIDTKIAIRGAPSFLGFGSDGKPQLSFPEPRFFKVIAVTPYCAYVKRWRDIDGRSHQNGIYIGRIDELSGKTAILRTDEKTRKVKAQFDQLDLEYNGVPMAYGWHEFDARDFRIRK